MTEQWTKETDGTWIMPTQQREFLDWLLAWPDQYPRFQKEWAEQNGVSERTVQRWKADERFQEMWQFEGERLTRSNERVYKMLTVLYRRGVDDGDVQAMKLYFEMADRYTPTQRHEVATDVSDMSDEALEAAIARLDRRPELLEAEIVG
jgi:hypothetical protein